MAEPCNIAFGRYLRTLRERRALSLDDVQSLSQAFAESLSKGYLSRCENGKQRVAFSKLAALSRIYEVPTEVLTERLEMDLELDRVGGPDTAGRTFAELMQAGWHASHHGRVWDAYASLRDAIPVSQTDEVQRRFFDRAEQIVVAQMNCCTGAINLRRIRYAIHELRHLQALGHTRARYSALMHERLSVCCRQLGQMSEARTHADLAVCQAEELRDPYVLGFALAGRARLAFEESDYEAALGFHERAYARFQEADLPLCRARELAGLAETYLRLRRLKASRHALLRCLELCRSLGDDKNVVVCLILLAEIERLEERPVVAGKWLDEAVRIAKDLDERVLRFKAECYLLRLAEERGDLLAARVLKKRLTRLATWLPSGLRDLAEFRQIAS